MDALRGPDAGTLLIRALRGNAGAAGVTMQVETIACTPWASATFVGTQHLLTIVALSTFAAIPGAIPGLRDWIAALPEAELAMRGHIVADLAVDHVETIGDRAHVTIAVLTLIDA